ncbi:efflux RND transporter periplasmic adaptor subunit [soil metagenome]
MKILRTLLIIVILAAAAAFVVHTLHEPPPGDLGYSGYAEGELVYVSSPMSGELQTLSVQRGDQAAKGAPLFQLEHAQETAARAEANETLRESQTRLDKAHTDFERAKDLRAKRVTSPQDYDAAEQASLAAEHNVATQQHALEQADWRLTQKNQTAPAPGLVYDTYYRPGEWVPAGTPVLSLLPPEYMKVRFFVPESDLGKFQTGRDLEVLLDGLPSALPGKVSFVSPKAEYTLPIIYSRENRGKLVFLVEASLAPEYARQLHPGAPVEVRLASAAKP